MSQTEIPIGYLFESSKTSLQNFRLSQINRAAEWRKTAQHAIDQAIKHEARALFAEWIEENGERIIALGTEKAS